MAYTLQPEIQIAGSGLTGTSGATSRTYTIVDSDITAVGMRVYVSGKFLTRGAGQEYTFDGTDLITFLIPVFNTDNISIFYYTETTTNPGSLYCSADDVKRIMGHTFDYGAATNPSDDWVTSFIEEATDEIDSRTHHAWRAVTVSNEYHDISSYPVPYESADTWIKISIKHRAVRAFSSGSGDKIEVWDGASWIDWVATKTEGRAGDYWADLKKGKLYMRFSLLFFKERGVRLTYRYGETTIPNDIRRACAMLAAVNLYRNDDMSDATAETGDPVVAPYDARISQMEREIKRILHNRVEVFAIN